jgi:hypothetical protein
MYSDSRSQIALPRSSIALSFRLAPVSDGRAKLADPTPFASLRERSSRASRLARSRHCTRCAPERRSPAAELLSDEIASTHYSSTYKQWAQAGVAGTVTWIMELHDVNAPIEIAPPEGQ